MTHTPGPWRVSDSLTNDGSRPIVSEDAGIAWARMIDLEQNKKLWQSTDPERDANAKLIAAAPALLEALVAIRHTWAGHSEQCETVLRRNNKKCDCDWPKVAAQCDAAIALAKGEE
jgi:hypothetical protein